MEAIKVEIDENKKMSRVLGLKAKVSRRFS